MNRIHLFAIAMTLGLSASACGGAGWNPQSANTAEPTVAASPEVAVTLERFRKLDAGADSFVDGAYGYVVFPTVGKGGAGIGGAYGEGEVYEQHTLVGTATLTQLTVGFQLGGQSYSEVIFFRDKRTLDDFRNGNFELGAQASAVAVTAGASTDAAYDGGVAVFTIAKGGLMYEATVAGQKFGFEPI